MQISECDVAYEIGNTSATKQTLNLNGTKIIPYQKGLVST